MQQSFKRAIITLGLAALAAPVLAQSDDLEQLFGGKPEPGTENRPAEEPNTRDTVVSPDANAADAGAQAPGETIGKGDAARPESEPAKTGRVIDEIIVTATKREASLRDIPASISALTGEMMEQAGLQNIDDILARVPGVNVYDDGLNSKRITVRGISTPNAAVNATTGVFLGETPFTDAYIPRVTLDPNPFDLATVEILKGPQGTLFGGSGLNGAIRYIPQQPVLGEWQSKAFAEVRTISQGGFAPIYGAALNVPLFNRDDLALRLVAFDRESAGWVDNTQLGIPDAHPTTQQGQRAILAWTPSDSWSLSLLATNQNTHIVDTSYTDNTEGRLSRGDAPRQSRFDNEYQLYSLTATWQLGWAELVSNTALMNKGLLALADISYLVPGGPVAAAGATIDNRSESRVQELRLVSTAGGAWDWLAGVFIYDFEVRDISQLEGGNDDTMTASGPLTLLNDGGPFTNVVVDDNGNLLGLRGDTLDKVNEYALFADATWHLRPSIRLNAGLRLYRFSYDAVTLATGAAAPAIYDPDSAETDGTQYWQYPSDHESGFSPKLSATWDVADHIMTYVAISKGFRFGGLNTTFVSTGGEVPAVFLSDTLWNAELGARTQWFGDSLIADATAFAIDWTDAQLDTLSPEGLRFIDNVGRVVGLGLESQITWLPAQIDGLSLTASVAHARIVTDSDYEAPSGTFVPAGSPWPLAPRWQTTASVDWRGDLGGATVNASLLHTWTDTARQAIDLPTEILGFSTWNLQLALKPANLSMPEIAINANNLTDTRGVTVVSATTPPGQAYIAPRNITLRLTQRF